MIKVNKKINLEQLDKELNANGLNGDLDKDGNIIAVGLADNSTITEQELEAGINAHIALPIPEPTVSEKLASVNLSLDDLKIALGLA